MLEEEKTYYSMYSRNAELYHHGIKGQKWGVQNGPPYPLDSDVSTGSRLKRDIDQIRDNYREEKRKAYENRLNKIEKKQNKISKEQNKLNKKNERLENRKDQVKKFIDKYSNKSVNEAAKGEYEDAMFDAIAPAAITATMLLALLGIKSAISHAGTSNEIKHNIEESEKSGPLKKISGPHSIKSDIKAINPNYYDKGAMEWKMNCALCSASYDMRRRGYDVTAMSSKKGRYLKEQARMYNMKPKDVSKAKDYSSFKKSLMAMPEGARGIMNVAAGDFGSMHAVAWEKHNNKIMIIDAQDGQVYDFNSAVRSRPPLINTTYTSQYSYFRTDDKDFNEKYIRDACRNRR